MSPAQWPLDPVLPPGSAPHQGCWIPTVSRVPEAHSLDTLQLAGAPAPGSHVKSEQLSPERLPPHCKPDSLEGAPQRRRPLPTACGIICPTAPPCLPSRLAAQGTESHPHCALATSKPKPVCWVLVGGGGAPLPLHSAPKGPIFTARGASGPRAERRNSPHLPPGQQESAGSSQSKGTLSPSHGASPPAVPFAI